MRGEIKWWEPQQNWHLDAWRGEDWWSFWTFRARHLAVEFATRRGIRLEAKP